MREPERLSSQAGRPLGQMVRAAQRVEASAQAKQRLYQRAGWLALVSGVSSFASAAAAAVGGAKVVTAVTTLTVAGAIGGYVFVELDAPKSAPKPQQPAPLVRQPDESLPEETAPAVSDTPAEMQAVRVEPEPKERASKAAPTTVDLLKAEIKLFDSARDAVRGGRAAVGLRHISDYQRRFPQGRFSLESRALRIEALAAAGRRGEASKLARAFIDQHPQSLLAKRVEPYAAHAD